MKNTTIYPGASWWPSWLVKVVICWLPAIAATLFTHGVLYIVFALLLGVWTWYLTTQLADANKYFIPPMVIGFICILLTHFVSSFLVWIVWAIIAWIFVSAPMTVAKMVNK